MSEYIIDLSHWNGKEFDDMAALKAAGVVAVILKATQGTDRIDHKFFARKQAAIDAGLLVGAYHFGNNKGTGKDQAEHFLDIVGNDVLPIFDWEDNRARTMPFEYALSFILTCRETRYPVIYSTYAFLNSQKIHKQGKNAWERSAISDILNCPLWLARYNATKEPEIPTGWNKWHLWQYTDGKAGGTPRNIPGFPPCDMNRFNGNVEELRRWWLGLPADHGTCLVCPTELGATCPNCGDKKS